MEKKGKIFVSPTNSQLTFQRDYGPTRMTSPTASVLEEPADEYLPDRPLALIYARGSRRSSSTG